MNKSIEKKCKNVKILLTDVDGVLTDCGMYYTNEGDVMKKFHTRDGMGVNLLRRNNIPTIIITKEKMHFLSIGLPVSE
jgi:N-acylneuraminate cytidylyltransferase